MKLLLRPARSVGLWWVFLTLAGLANISLWLALYQSTKPLAARLDGGPTMLVLSACYVFGCAFRSFLPRADVQRFCLFDTWLSSIVVGRSVATVAEVAFAAQWALMLDLLGGLTGVKAASHLALWVIPLIVTAQLCSWYGVLTTNTLANAIENSIWALTFTLIGMVLCAVLPHFDGVAFAALGITLAGIACYIAFLVAVDVPMYLGRRQSPRGHLGLLEGIRDAAFTRIVTHDFRHWRQEIPWMSLYFTVAVWMSLGLTFTYTMRHELAQSVTTLTGLERSKPEWQSEPAAYHHLANPRR